MQKLWKILATTDPSKRNGALPYVSKNARTPKVVLLDTILKAYYLHFNYFKTDGPMGYNRAKITMTVTEYDDKLVITANDKNGIIVDGPGSRIGGGIDNAMEKALVYYNSL